MILVTGAAGKTGQALTRALVERGERVRAFVRSDEQAVSLKALGAAEVLVGDIRAADDYRQAAQGTRVVYHICPNMSPDEPAIGRVGIEAAQLGGVRRFVYHSVLHPQSEAMPHHWAKLRVEEMVLESGLDFTILQATAYMQNTLAGRAEIVERGIYRVPYGAETRLSMVDLKDMVQAAAIVLTEDGHSAATYELVGCEALTQVEVAAVFAKELGREVRAEQVPVDEWEQSARAAGLGDYQVDTLLSMFAYYDAFGLRGNTNMLGWLLRREPVKFSAFVEREIAVMRDV